MSRISNTFQNKAKILSLYCTAGYPKLNSTIEMMKALQQHGADIIELGMPYSDPLADGPVIQQSSAIALANGMTIKKLFEQLQDFRRSPSIGGVGEIIPVILMGYMNPVLQYGFEKFCEDAAAVGIDCLILPDLPEHEFETTYGAIIKKYGLDFLFLVTPETSNERIRKLDSLSTGFLYAVSSSSTTGSNNQVAVADNYLRKLKDLKLNNPILVGFGINNKESFEAVCKLANGGIIGSAYIKALENSTDVNASTKSFLSSILGGEGF
ncbi:MAG TPA: tryptophan synthase subunit alpha [Chitinophagaceae bacterium]|nr:tryptophan synthase subunit alpha [Chitinophagaceae bacterium]